MKRPTKKQRQIIYKQLVDGRIAENCLMGFGTKVPQVGQYVITGLQAGNHQGQKGWDKYIGYVVQIRKEAGAFGSDLYFLRHPDGNIITHENQCFYSLTPEQLILAKSIFKYSPQDEDYTQPFTIGGKYPETGKIIEKNNNHPPIDNSLMMSITTTDSNGDKTITVC